MGKRVRNVPIAPVLLATLLAMSPGLFSAVLPSCSLIKKLSLVFPSLSLSLDLGLTVVVINS